MVNTTATPHVDPYPSQNIAWYLLGILVIANVLSFVDRQILVLLVQPLRQDLHISDTEISLLQGFAFTILYSMLGLPLGRYADRHNRRNLIVFGVAVWSLMTMACGFAQTLGQLFVARIGVGIGEATLAPAAYSMICDAFRPQKRGTALGVYSSAIFLGIGVSVVLGGLVMALIHGAAEVTLPFVGIVRSWQAAFLCVGAPGLLIALLILTVAEPSRHAAPGSRPEGPTLTDALHYLAQHRAAFTLQLLGYSCIALAAYGLGSWMPTFFIRVHHWSASQAGIYYGLCVAIFGTLGGILGGVLSDRWIAAGRRDARLLLSVIGALCWIPLIVGTVYAPSAGVALASIAVGVGFSSFVNGLGPTTVHDIVPGWLRGQATALFFFVINFLGLGIGPTAVALVTDHVFGSDLALRHSIPLVAIPAIVLGIALLLAARGAYRRAVAALDGSPSGERREAPVREIGLLKEETS
ncbi:MAG: MFS transporter [Pseudomonadota bacterium]